MSERKFETTGAFRDLIDTMRALEETFLAGGQAVEQDVSVIRRKPPPNRRPVWSKWRM